MQLTVATAAFVATASASYLAQRETASSRNATCSLEKAYAKVVNRCSYDVYLWSIDKELGCTAESAFKLAQGDFYHENFRSGTNGGISIKLSKYETCGGKDITQLEYKIDETAGYAGNYLDMSFVDCTGNLEDCPGRTDGFYLKSGNEGGVYTSAVDNEHCPIFNVYNAEDAAKVSYIKWDDRQTKYCNADANLQLFLCGGEAPDAEDDTPYASPSSSSEVESTPSPTSTSSKHQPTSSIPAASSSTEDAYVVAAAAVTEAPAAPVIKTEVVYVTEYVNRRHAHGRRHQHYHA